MTPTERALKTVEKSNDNWRKTVLSLYVQGVSDKEIMRELKLSKGSWDTLYENILDSDFQELVDFGRLMAQAWWESQGRIHLRSKGFNTGLYSFMMKNRFGWSERTAEIVTSLDYENKDSEALLKEITDLNKKMALGRDKS